MFVAAAVDVAGTPLLALPVELRSMRNVLILSQGEFDRLVAFVRDEARLQVFPMAPKQPLEALL